MKIGRASQIKPGNRFKINPENLLDPILTATSVTIKKSAILVATENDQLISFGPTDLVSLGN